MMIKTERTDRGHGSPYDRGSADSWYGRTPVPHYFEEGSYSSTRYAAEDMTEKELADYWQGWKDNESDPDARKEW